MSPSTSSLLSSYLSKFNAISAIPPLFKENTEVQHYQIQYLFNLLTTLADQLPTQEEKYDTVFLLVT